ncbi:secreted RxLR effector protein 161-like [Lycium barbarum]|uniref:secreted RxLR effector protein 161-like n=1 Tax=Lycium barbarum TaxID=112863 RepID=UPI00293EB2B3|nr:secreted RxLR effector protein 161-like [Lycium barbarum]
MEQPHGFVSKQFPSHVCHLKKALYGLKQAPRAWYGKVAQYLIFCGFRVSDCDTNDRRSTSGYCFSMGSTVVSWYNKKKDVVALSSTEVKYIAVTMAAQE